jgi:hypothetical protein
LKASGRGVAVAAPLHGEKADDGGLQKGPDRAGTGDSGGRPARVGERRGLPFRVVEEVDPLGVGKDLGGVEPGGRFREGDAMTSHGKTITGGRFQLADRWEGKVPVPLVGGSGTLKTSGGKAGKMTAMGSDPTGISVRTRIFPLAFILLLFKTNVVIDGVESTLPWGTHFFSVPPGSHEVRVSFRYVLSRTMGENSVMVDVAAGQTTNVRYRSPILVFLKGPIKVVA